MQGEGDGGGMKTPAEEKMLLRECRAALGELLEKKPQFGGLRCGSTTLGNLHAQLYEYRNYTCPDETDLPKARSALRQAGGGGS